MEGSDVSIFATGHMLWKALEAEKILFKMGISCEVINIHTIKGTNGIFFSRNHTIASDTIVANIKGGIATAKFLSLL